MLSVIDGQTNKILICSYRQFISKTHVIAYIHICQNFYGLSFTDMGSPVQLYMLKRILFF